MRQPLPAITGKPMSIKRKDDVPGEHLKAYRLIPVPYHYKQAVKTDLDRDVRLGVIERVTQGEITEHGSRMVITPKANGKPRRTIDIASILITKNCFYCLTFCC